MTHPTLTRTREMLVALAKLKEKRNARASEIGVDLQGMRLVLQDARRSYRQGKQLVDEQCSEIDSEILAVREALVEVNAERKAYLASKRKG